MADVSYTSGGGGYNLSVPGLGGYGMGGGIGGAMGDLSWLSTLAKRKAAQEMQMRQLQLQQMQKGMRGPTGISGVDPYEQKMKELAMQQEIAKTQAMTGRAPTRHVNMLNSTGPYTVQDPLAMTGAQRAMFPSGSAMTAPIAPAGGEEFDRFAEGTRSLNSPSSIARQNRQADQEESISDMATRMYGDWRGDSAKREARRQQLSSYGLR